MEAGGRPDRLELREVPGERSEEGVPSPAIDRSEAAEVAVELAAREEVGEGELLERRRSVVGLVLRRGDLVDESTRDDEPAEAEARGERLARRPGVDDVVGREALERPDGRPVVALLRVVVVLEDQRPAADGPGEERRAPLGRQDGAGRRLVGRRDEDAVGVARGERLDHDPGRVDRDRDDLQAGRGDDPTHLRVGGVLERDAARATRPEDPADEGEPLVEAGARDDPVGVGRRSPDPVEVGGEGIAELGHASPVEVREALARGDVQDAAERAEPLGPGEERDVGAARMELDREPFGARSARSLRGGRRPLRDPRRAARTADEVALGDELLVRLDDDAARDAQLGGEGARGRDERAGPQAARSDRLAQLVLELPVERGGPRPIEPDEQLDG